MTIWGKLAGAAAGLMVGGPLGALLGGLAGHMADRAMETPEEKQARVQIAFTVGVIALGAKMAKADGRVTRDEIAAFRKTFTLADEDTAAVARLFNLAKQDTAGFEAYADQLARLMRAKPQLLEAVLDGLFDIALADKTLHPSEDRFLAEVATRFGIDKQQYHSIRSRHVVSIDHDPYAILEVEPNITDDELRQHYRRLVAAHHPDRMLAKGLPPEFIALADRKLAAINAAYDEIRRLRKQ